MDCDLLQMHKTIRIPRLQLIALNNLIGNVHLPSFHHLNQEEIDSRYLFLIFPELSLLFLTMWRSGGVGRSAYCGLDNQDNATTNQSHFAER